VNGITVVRRGHATVRIGAIALVSLVSTGTSRATVFIQLGGPATGYVAVSNFKNSSSQNGIEGNFTSGPNLGLPDPNHNGLPEFPNYRMANGNYTAIIVGPRSTTSNYEAFAGFSTGTFNGDPIAINNQVISDGAFNSLSAGRIDFDNSLLSGVGTEVIPADALSFNLNTYLWDGNVTPSMTGDPRSNYNAPYASPEAPLAISPFSPILSPANDGTAAGNAQLFYEISLSGVTGSGLTFQDGSLVSIDLVGTVNIAARVAPFYSFGALSYTGSFTASDLDYEFDVSGTSSLSIFSGVNLIMNRAGTVAVIPEPSAGLVLTVLAAASTALLRRRPGRRHLPA
jgi:hypothetical protein